MRQPPAVSLTRCATYGDSLPTAVAAALAPLGGIGAFVRPGQTVLVKPNMLTDRPPEQAVTTHPELVRAIVRLVSGAGAKPVVADSPANAVKLDRVWDRTGFGAMCAQERVPLLNLEEAGSTPFETDGCRFSIAKPVLDADAIINVPKVKTHMLTTMTAGVKNMYGAVPGFQKTNLHQIHPLPSDFGVLMAAIYTRATPTLTIADAVVGMDGDGPSAGTPAPLGFLAAAADAVSLDLVLCRILGVNPSAVPYLPRLLGGGNRPAADDLQTAGVPPRELTPGSFRVPATLAAKLIPRFVLAMLPKLVWIRPAISDACVSCGRCVRACPGGALAVETQGGRPVLTPRKCVGCCCCHEVCPKAAVRMTQSPLLRLIRRGPMV